MARREVRTDDAPAPSGSYSQGIVAGDYLYLSGQGPFDRHGNLVDDSFAAQVRQVLANPGERNNEPRQNSGT